MNRLVRIQIHKITLCAVFVVITVILGRLSLYIPIGGLPSMRFSLIAIPIVIGAFLLGPIYGGIIGGLGDLIGAFLFPVGAYFFGFTLDSALLGIIPGLIFYFATKNRFIIPIICGSLFIIVAGIFTVFFTNYQIITISKVEIELTVLLKTLIICCFILLFIAGFATIFFAYKRKKNIIVIYALTALLANEILISALLASVWKQLLYALPYTLNVGLALIYMLINVPLKTIIISLVYSPISKMVHVQNSGVSLNKSDRIN